MDLILFIVDFILTIQTGSGNNKLMPMYCCQSGLHVVTELSSTKAISTVYKNRFNTSTRYLGTSSREKWRYAGSARTQYTLNDWNDEYILKRLFDYHVKRRTLANANWKYFFTSWIKTENPIIELEPALHAIYLKGYEFSERELTSIMNKSPNGEADKVAFAALYKSSFLTSIPKNTPNAAHTF
ncbi:unnamed protein product [Rhizophagus irregularis]|nr:unnamed protein product [Rhizophagus irregularis]